MSFLLLVILILALGCLLCAIAEGCERVADWVQMRRLAIRESPAPDERDSIQRFRRIMSEVKQS